MGDGCWELINEEEFLLRQHQEEIVDQFDREQVSMICSPYQAEPGTSDFATDAYAALGDENLAYDEDYYDGQDHIFTTDFGGVEEPFVQPNPRRTVRSPSNGNPQRTLSYEEGHHSAQSSPNRNRYDALQDPQGEAEEDVTLNALTIPDNQVREQDDPQGDETAANTEELTEPQENDIQDQEDNVENSDFRMASSK